MLKCKHCGGSRSVKNGFSRGKQVYKCKECFKTYLEGDRRTKYSFEQKMRVLKWYLDGAGIRSISRNEGISTPLIIKWLRGFSKILRAKMSEINIPEDVKEIQILELDELFTYCQKKLPKSTYGLLLIESEIKLLTLK
jgi:transposase-like protein